MEIEKSLGNEATIDRCFDVLEKAMGQKGAPIGEIRTWGGKEYIKTPKGWRAKPKGFREKKNDGSKQSAPTGKLDASLASINVANSPLSGGKKYWVDFKHMNIGSFGVSEMEKEADSIHTKGFRDRDDAKNAIDTFVEKWNDFLNKRNGDTEKKEGMKNVSEDSKIKPKESRSSEDKVKNDLSSLSEWVVEPRSMEEKVYGKGAILPPKTNVVGESTPEHLAAQRLVRAGMLEPLGRKLNYAPAYKLTDKGKELFSQVNGTKNTPVFDGKFVNLDGSEFGLRNILDKTKGDRLLIRQTKINGSIKGIDEALIHSGWGYSMDKDENGKYEIGGPYILFYRKK